MRLCGVEAPFSASRRDSTSIKLPSALPGSKQLMRRYRSKIHQRIKTSNTVRIAETVTSTDFRIISSQETIRALGLNSAPDHSPFQPNDGGHRENADEPQGNPRLDEEAASDY